MNAFTKSVIKNTSAEAVVGCGCTLVLLTGIAGFCAFWGWVIVHIVHVLERAVK
jgi:hypothetical protein